MSIKRQLSRIAFLPVAAPRLYWCEFWNGIRYRSNKEKRVAKNWFAYERYRTAVMNKLRRKYKKEAAAMADGILKNPQYALHSGAKKVWVYWDQGFERAPDLVRLCAQSIAKQLGGGREVILLSDDNIGQYVSFPDFIWDKYRKGLIGKALFADLLRLELLIKHGGLWLDATVLCSNKHIPSYIFDSDLFLFQMTPMEHRIFPTRIESFFINAKTNNPLLILCRDLLYLYLKKHNYIVDYYIIYEMLELAIETMPDEWAKVIYYPRTDIFTLADEIYKPYNPELIQILLDRFPFHKLSYKEPKAENSAIDYLIAHPELVIKE